jgi:NTP pyrophosphatase (non-canonical NTP hydrolase)
LIDILSYLLINLFISHIYGIIITNLLILLLLVSWRFFFQFLGGSRMSYQDFVVSTKRYSRDYAVIYPALGLASEAGEVAGKVKKVLRDAAGQLDVEQASKIIDELGDVLWYVTCLIDDLGYTLDEVIERNTAKLEARVANNTIHGSGDNR